MYLFATLFADGAFRAIMMGLMNFFNVEILIVLFSIGFVSFNGRNDLLIETAHIAFIACVLIMPFATNRLFKNFAFDAFTTF